MAIRPEVIDWWKRQRSLPQISRPQTIMQPQTGQTYRRPNSMSEYLLGESEEDRKNRELLEMLREQARLGQATGDGFSGQTPERFAGPPSRLAAMLARVLDPEGERKVVGDRYEQAFRNRVENAEQMETPETKASDNMLSQRRRLMGRNQRAQEGRLPGYQPEGLAADEQQRVSNRLMRSARGGMVDETSPLNSRAGLYAAAAERDQAKELQKQAEQEAMSNRFRSLQATRDPDAIVESRTPVGRSAGLKRGQSRVVKTFAEKIAGVEDDPTTPMDESIRYRAEWDFGKGSDEANQAALEELKQSGREGAQQRRQARQERTAAISEKFRAEQAERGQQQQLMNTIRQMMGLDAATKGQAHATASFLGMLGQGMGPQAPKPTDDADRDRKVSVALALLDPASSNEDKEMGRSILQGLFSGNGEGQVVRPVPQTLEEKQVKSDYNQAVTDMRNAASDGKGDTDPVTVLIDALDAGTITDAMAIDASKEIGPSGEARIKRVVEHRKKAKEESQKRWSAISDLGQIGVIY